MPGVTLYCGYAVPAYTVIVVSFAWILAQATSNIAFFVSKVGSHSLRFPRGGIEARSIVPNTRTGLVVVISTCVLGPIGAISESVVASAGPSRGCHEKSHEELEYLDKSSGAIVSENGIRDQMSVMASFWQSQNKEFQTLRMRLDRGGNIEWSTNKGLVLL
jgi:hypothetical protein